MQALTGREFKNMVKGAGLTMRDVAKEASVGNSSVSQWSNGNQDIMYEGTYKRLYNAYLKLSGQNESNN